MNRRKFLTKLASATAIALAAGATTVMIEGCSINIADAINAVLNSALAVLKVAEPGASWIGDLSGAITALQQAEATWQSGGAASIVVDALNTLEAVLAVIPATAVYSPLIDILVAAIETVMGAFGVSTQIKTMVSAKRPAVVSSPHYGKAALNKPNFLHPTWTGAYKAQWNDKAKAIGLPQAELK